MISPSARQDILQGYGLFMLAWSAYESLLDVFIEKEAKLDPLHAIVIISGLGFERKASIARTLLSLRQPKASEAIKLINKIANEASRNSVVHGKVYENEDSITFRRYDTDQTIKTKIKTFKGQKLLCLAQDILDLAEKLQAELSISEEELEQHGKTAKILTNKFLTSPRVPNSTSSS